MFSFLQSLDPIAWRMIERILAVAIGGVAIYLGYRLFLQVPERHDSQGSITLPWDITVLLSRVGPGVFFALFGAAVVGYGLHESVSYTRERSSQTAQATGGPNASATERVIWGGASPRMTTQPDEALTAARLRARLEIEFLNSLPALLRGDLKDEQERDVSQRTAALKLGVMHLLWGGDWGDFAAFKDWAQGSASEPIPKGLEAAAQYFLAGKKEIKPRSGS
jgi:hypothetical protein